MDHIVSLVAKKSDAVAPCERTACLPVLAIWLTKKEHQTSRRDDGKPGESKEFEAIASSCRNAYCDTGTLRSFSTATLLAGPRDRT